MAKRTPEAIKAPNDEGVSFPQVVEDVPKLRSLNQGAAAGIGEDPIATCRIQCVELEGGILLFRRDPCVSEERHVADRLTTQMTAWRCDIDFGHGFWTAHPRAGLRGCDRLRNDRLRTPAPAVRGCVLTHESDFAGLSNG